MTLETTRKEKVKNKKVLLFSGGMDCLCLNQIYKPDVLLHIKYGGQYGKMEDNAIRKLVEKKAIDEKKLFTCEIGRWLGTRERDDLIIPNRNIYFVTLATEYGETIWLGSVKGDRSFDKDEPFYRKMERLLNHVNAAQHWTEKRVFHVSSPIKHLTKSQLVSQFLKKKGEKSWLLDSYSCYSGSTMLCGTCKACLRKAIALHNNGIIIPKKYFLNDPRENRELKDLRDMIMRGKYRGEEDKDICKFMGWKYGT